MHLRHALRSLSGVAVAVLAASASAQTDPSLPEVLISASHLALTEAAVNQHVHVFTREQIEAHPAASVAEFLQRQAGIPVDRGGRRAGYGSLYLRGADPSHVVVLIDGVRQNDPLSSRGSAVDLNSLSLDDIERIEVIRGNTSVAHGEALAGVVALFTAAATGKQRRVQAEAGGDGARSLAASIVSPPLRLSAVHREDGRVPLGRTRTDAFNLGQRVRSGPMLMQLHARFVESVQRGFPDDSGGVRFAVNRALESNRLRTGQLSGRWRRDLGDAGALDLGLQFFAREGRQDMPAVAPGLRDPFGLPRLRADSDYDRLAGHLHWLTPVRGGTVLAGLELQRERGRLDSTIYFGQAIPAFFALTRRTHSVFAEMQGSAGALRYHVGLRGESTPGEGKAVHPALGLQYALAEGHGRIGAGLSSAAKLPSFFALGHPLVGNAELRRESTRQFEMFYARDAADGSRLRLTAFRARYLALVDFEAGPPPRLVNRGVLDVSGIEWTWRKPLGRTTTLRAEGTVMDLERPAGAEPLRHRPHQQWLLGIDTRWPAGWQFAADLVHVGSRSDSSIPTGGATLASYRQLHLSVTRSQGAWAFYGAIDNALDRRADEVIGTPIGGRRLRVGLRFAH